MFYTYVIYSKSKDRYYTGHTHDLELRIERHNQGWSKSTKSGIPWELVYYETHPSKSLAMKRELEIKRWKNRKLIEELISKT